ncbi:UDP-N-acetylglucosamine--N-acetylmuramyl-(pentapeptide) pyrophosphoryl-undecaprenol N-acetylglucosamine transferase [Alphaproteobacteria bacterium]|nr:UDP-N-acetylglucosamine--N-acetylmuramyl-(pentapeptide) pyrophosphoryl-undecaprenol N-acetylglucosamine transferase [Alphaproteobacteria bacterium]
MKVSICSGGTGGHMFPACALFEILKERGHSVYMITDTRGDVFCSNIHNKVIVKTIRISRKKAVHAVVGFVRMFWKFLRMWFRDSPDVIVGFGGMFTVIPILVAKCFGSNVIIYEQNSILGKANRLLSYFSDSNASFFDLGNGWKHIPSPVRDEFIKLKDVPYICDEKVRIIIIGGSQGARSFSDIIPMALEKVPLDQRKNIEIVQQVSNEMRQSLEDRYGKLGVQSTLMSFVHNMAEEMSNSQLVICRSGASTLAELSTIGRPAILIPYPGATDNHQAFNAAYYVRKQAAWMVEEKDGIIEKLSSIISEVLVNRELLKLAASNMINSSMSDSRDSFVKLIESMCN